jgi:hypothetical protein
MNNTLSLRNSNSLFGKVFDELFLYAEVEGRVSYYTHKYRYSKGGGGVTYFGGAGGFITPMYFGGGGGSGIVDASVLVKENGETMKLRNLLSKKDLKEFFSDCPSLVNLIKEDIATRDKLDIIVEFYNLYCK